MSAYHDPSEPRSFSSTGYVATEAGRLVPCVLPSQCRFHEAAGPNCEIVWHHERERKTGPCFPVTVVRCKVHRKAFTVYPPGHVPYGREAIAPVDFAGEPVRNEAPTGALAWSSTVFGAAYDAAAGRAWPRESTPGQSRWQTQQRRLALCAQLIGLGMPSGRRDEELAYSLRLPLLVWSDARRSYECATGYQARGRALVELVEHLEPGRCVLERVLACGVQAGLFGEVRWWERSAAGPRCRVFRLGGTPSG